MLCLASLSHSFCSLFSLLASLSLGGWALWVALGGLACLGSVSFLVVCLALGLVLWLFGSLAFWVFLVGPGAAGWLGLRLLCGKNGGYVT